MLVDRVKQRVCFYKYGLELSNIKIVITPEAFTEVQTDVVTSDNGKIELFGVPVEINDKIIIDFYVTEIV